MPISENASLQTKTNSWQAFRELLLLSFPIMIGQLSQMLIAMGDMVVASWYSTEAVAAVGLGLAVLHPIFISGLGFLVATSPIVSQLRGEGKDTHKLAFSSLILGLLASLPVATIMYAASQFVGYLKYPDHLTTLMQQFIAVTALSVPGAFVFLALKEYLQAQEKVFFANALSFISVSLNVALCFLFVFGSSFFPAMGFEGLAWASVTIRWFMGIAMVLYVLKDLLSCREINLEFLGKVTRLGIPIAGTFFIEVLAFSLLTLLVGYFGEAQSAASNIVLNLASATFMIAVAIAGAVSVKVGYHYGKKNIDDMRLYARVGFFSVFVYNGIMTLIYLFLPHLLLALYQPKPEVIFFGLKMIIWVAIFQIFDGVQVVLSGILRGVSISKITAAVMLLAYWIVGLPLGYMLSYRMGYEGQGFWMGMAVALATVACVLGVYTYKTFASFDRSTL